MSGRNLHLQRPARDDRDLGKRRKTIIARKQAGTSSKPERPIDSSTVSSIPEQSRLRGPQHPDSREATLQNAITQESSARLSARDLTTKNSAADLLNVPKRMKGRSGPSGSKRGGLSQSIQSVRTRNQYNFDGSSNRARDTNNGINWNNGIGNPTRRLAKRPEPHTTSHWLYSPSSVPSERQNEDDPQRGEAHPWPKPIMSFNVMARSARKTILRHIPSTAKRAANHPSRRPDPGSSDSELEYASSDTDLPKADDPPSNTPSDSLIERMAQVLLPEFNARERTPFLRRNLRSCFRCRFETQLNSREVWKARHIVQKCPGISVLYSFEDENGDQHNRFEGSISSWVCPLCKLLGNLRSREELEFHLTRDHREFSYSWTKLPSGNVQLRIRLPEVLDSESEDEEDELDSSSSDDDSVEVLEILTATRQQSTPALIIDVDADEDVKPFLRGSSVAHTVLQPTPVKAQPREESPRPSRLRSTPAVVQMRPDRPPDAPHPPVFITSSQTDVVGRRTAKGKAPARDRDDSSSREDTPVLPSPHRYPTPPPRSNLEGPSAVYPYLPRDQYSARPGGAKLYDLLNTLSLEPFGLMAWFIVEREEDVFELDDLRDEDKVMQALWARWILLNRNKFVANYLLGMKDFIDEYWQMIHRAAGFAALRVWLLVFVSNRYLTGTDFCDLLKYYSDLVGMNLWK
ncbi:hypothetical protein SCHPADRAFT_1002977 [Schizopora paradoxa]|uniref:Uncharacterized protein n=1 Tax=Schizopora paradoxa TaxID=27342 RepID=A0A0H2R0R4_9AGAM|nr:hypothetical protein SCHPADRAFT_1002977 [Schizopora paradoxa]